MGWEFGTALGSAGFDIPPFDGGYAAVNDDRYDNAAGTANLASGDILDSPIMNLSGATGVVLEFDYYGEPDAPGNCKFLSSTNGGATWSLTYTVLDDGSWRHLYFVLPSVSATTRIRFLFEDLGGRSNGYAIDNVRLYQPGAREGEIIRPFTSGQMPQTGGFVGGKFRSTGTDTLTSIGFAYSVDGGTPVAGTLSGISLATNRYLPFSHPVPVSFASTGMHDLKLWITDLNGMGPDDSPENDTVAWSVEVLPEMPPRHPVLTDITGAWCTFCSDGSWRHDVALETYPDAIGVGIHLYDMMDSASLSWTGARMNAWLNTGGGYPSFCADHSPFAEIPGLDFFPSDANLFTHERLLNYEPASATVTEATYDPVTRLVTATVEATFYDTLTGDYRLNLFVTLDSLSGTGTGWDQVNAANTTPGHYYYGWGDPILGFQHKHVFMTALGAEYGRGGVIPSSVVPGSSYSTTFSFTLPEVFWGAINQTGLITPGLVNLVGVVQKYNASDAMDRRILNASEHELEVLTGAGQAQANGGLTVFPNPTTGVLHVRLPAGAMAQSWECVDALGRVVPVNPQMESGAFHWDASGLAPGVYFLKVVLQDGSCLTARWMLHGQ